MFQLAMRCREKFVAKFCEIFYMITEKSTRNRNLCCSVGLIGILLVMVEKFEGAIVPTGEVRGNYYSYICNHAI